ncbi:Alpha/Beta hydrolase protein [Calycina marina]|uniref:Alpha/Beta hydrolase protein n=1 Tax=Calycina marina TaxID=1763456 RepID=A0A9P7Z7T9_9HELO|nr:Alpha/Beta hydrolase protein [Calycina marina]
MPLFGPSKKRRSAQRATLQATASHVRFPPDQVGLASSQQQRPSTSHGYDSYYATNLQSWAPPPPTSQQLLVATSHPLRSKKSALSNLRPGPAVNLLATSKAPDCPHLYQGAVLYDTLASKFNAAVTQIDNGCFGGDERDLAVSQQPHPVWQQEQQVSGYGESGQEKSKGIVSNGVSSALTTTNYFSKVSLYANSRLPPNLPPMKLYMPTFPLLCLAAQYSERVYMKPSGQEKETHVDAGGRRLVLKSCPMDDQNTIVFAIRGTQTFMDWAVNLKSEPISSEGFLDDPGNYCHSGFLTVAKKMILPVAARLRNLLQEDPGRSKCSLIITGHSAGGAVAALLYSHMLSTTPATQSELNILTSCFKRLHCITFGAPPVSLLPLAKPEDPKLKKSVFLSFVNEGDPVTRADKDYVRSLLDLYAKPAPGSTCIITETLTPQRIQPFAASIGGKSSSSLTLYKKRASPIMSRSYLSAIQPPLWPVPEATLSNAGKLVLLRGVERYEKVQHGMRKPVNERMEEGVIAQMISDDLLRGVIWGDPVCHMMRLYARRIEILATNAVMGG